MREKKGLFERVRWDLNPYISGSSNFPVKLLAVSTKNQSRPMNRKSANKEAKNPFQKITFIIELRERDEFILN